MVISQGELLRRAQAGDRDALGELLKRHAPEVRRSLEGQIPRRWQSLLSTADIMQQTFTDAFRGISEFEPTKCSAFSAWLITLARNNLCDAIRALEAKKRGGGRRRIRTDSEQTSLESIYQHLMGADVLTAPSRHARLIEAEEALRTALRRLPEPHRRVVQLHDLEGRSMKEVAVSIGRSVGAAYLLRIRAHERLRELLAGKSTVFRDLS